MAFLFGRGRTRTNTIDLSKQAKDHVLKLDGAGGPAKVTIIPIYPYHMETWRDMEH